MSSDDDDFTIAVAPCCRRGAMVGWHGGASAAARFVRRHGPPHPALNTCDAGLMLSSSSALTFC
jgi:hypothetical protein